MKWICNKKTAEIGKSLAAIGLALVIGALFILLAGESPIRAYTSLIQGALGTPQSIANTISKSIPLAFTGLAVAMGNANEHVKKVCAVQVADNNHGGCAQAIRRYLLGEDI